MMHSDCDGQWSPDECVVLKQELEAIRDEMTKLPAVPFPAGWQQQVAEEFGLTSQRALDCFITVDGENLVDAIARLADLAIKLGKPIDFM
jgi:Immunity protein 70